MHVRKIINKEVYAVFKVLKCAINPMDSIFSFKITHFLVKSFVTFVIFTFKVRILCRIKLIFWKKFLKT